MVRTRSANGSKRDNSKKVRPKNPKTPPSRCSPTCIASLMEYFREKAVDKLDEVDRMCFSFLKHIAKWTVNQKMYVPLAKAYDRESISLCLGTRRIPFNIETVTRYLGLPNHGVSIQKPKTPQET
ncbi:hypothetical protein PIB30_061493 [Stylosanthes scabra]|uniref:Uncharacterized protein n=1 Tax=Stylosanthes scabra TaxID=79078 RepID=A0ABU6RL77_9FABA|nr:hypothetical protein [Stylosanthes scabra]